MKLIKSEESGNHIINTYLLDDGSTHTAVLEWRRGIIMAPLSIPRDALKEASDRIP